MRQTLRGPPPPRSSTLRSKSNTTSHRPILQSTQVISNVESWLENVHPGTNRPPLAADIRNSNRAFYTKARKPFTEELDKSPGESQDVLGYPSKRIWVVLRVVLRIVSFIFSAICLGILVSMARMLRANGFLDEYIIAYVICSFAMAWNGSDLLITAVLPRERGSRLLLQSRLILDLTVLAGAAVAAGFAIHDYLRRWWEYFYYERHKDKKMATAVFLILIMIIHSYLFMFYLLKELRIRRREGQQYTPRVMFLPSGAAVMVTPHPLPNQSVTTRAPPVEMSRMGTRSVGSRATPSDRNQSMDSRRMDQSTVVLPQPPSLAVTRPPLPLPPALATPTIEAARRAQGRQGIPTRKPVPTNIVAMATVVTAQVESSQVGTHYAMPWPGPDHQPDEAELERAARGEAQAQWMSLHGMHLDKGKGKATTSGEPDSPA